MPLRWLFLPLALTLLPSLLSCEVLGETGTNQTPEHDTTLVGPTWQVVAFEDPTRIPSGVGSEPLSIRFRADGTLKGMSRTNEFYGTYSYGLDGSFSANPKGSTYAGVPEGSKYFDFMLALDRAVIYDIHGDELRISYDNGQTLYLEVKTNGSSG